VVRSNSEATDVQDHIAVEAEGAVNLRFVQCFIERCSNGFDFHNGSRNCIIDNLFTEAMGRDFVGDYFLVRFNKDNVPNLMMTISNSLLRGDDMSRGDGLIVGGRSHIAISNSFINNVQFAISKGPLFDPLTIVGASENLYTLIGNVETAFTDTTGDTDGSTGVIPGMTTTKGLLAGHIVTVSAGFPAGTITIVSVDSATQITVDVNSNSAQTDVTVTRVTLGTPTDIPAGQLIGTDGKDGLLCKNLSASNAVLTPKVQTDGNLTLAPGDGGTGIILPGTTTDLGNDSNRFNKMFIGDINLSVAFASTTANFRLINLATSDPVVANRLWNDSGTVKISSG